MFWRLGLLEDNRPVAVTVWLNDVWTRPGLRVDQGAERVHVRVFQLAQAAVFEHHSGQRRSGPRVVRGPPRRCCGRPCPAGALELEPVEENLRKLLGRIDVEDRAGLAVDLLGHVGQGLVQLAGHLPQQSRIDRDAGVLHLDQHLDQRHLDLVEQLVELGLTLQAVLKAQIKLIGDVGILGGVLRRRRPGPPDRT